MRLIYLAIVVSLSLMALGQGLESIELSNARVANVDAVVEQAVRGK